MDDSRHSISLDARRGAEAVPIVIDARRDAGFAGAARASARQRLAPFDQIEIAPLP
jgi:hypothetical protein